VPDAASSQSQHKRIARRILACLANELDGPSVARSRKGDPRR
jgi:hypothetical protein